MSILAGTSIRQCAAALLMAIAAASPVTAADPPRSGHPVFDTTVRLVLGEFYDAGALDIFEQAVRREIEDASEPLGSESPDERVDRAIDKVIASLDVSHMGRFEPDSIAYFELADVFRFAIRNDMRRLFPPRGEVVYDGIGLVAETVAGRLHVTDVYDGAPAARAGILVGDELLAVGGQPYDEIASFRGKAGSTVPVRLRRDAQAEPFEVSVSVERLQPLTAFEKAITESAAVFERDGKRIGYIRLWTLAARRSMENVGEALVRGALKDADGLVLDLRGRWGGGSSDAAEMFVGDTPPFSLIDRSGKTVLANVRWRQPVVALIDEGTRSGLEVFAYALQANGIPLVGSRSAGALLAGRAYLLPDDSLLEIAVSDAVIGDDIRLEGTGVEPDIAVPFRLPYAAGRDPQKDAAITEMSRILDSAPDD